MAYKVERPAKFWEGGGSGGGSIGRIRYFAAGEDAPSNYRPADGGDFRDLHDYGAWVESDASVFGGAGKVLTSFSTWNGAGSNYFPNGRNQIMYKDIVFVMAWSSGSNSLIARYEAIEANGNLNKLSNINDSTNAPGTPSAWNITNGKLILFTPTKVAIKNDPLQNNTLFDGGYTFVPNVAGGGAPNTAPVYFKGKYYTTTPTFLRSCLGVDWTQWPTSPKFWGASAIFDLIVGRIGNAEVLVAISNAGEVWTTPDGTTWTQQPNAPDVTLTSGGARLVYDGNGAFWLNDGNKGSNPTLWWTEDFVSWNVSATPFYGGASVIVSRLDAGGGYVAVAGVNPTGLNLVLGLSVDRGATWENLYFTNDQPPYSNNVPVAVATNGAYASTLTVYQSGVTYYGWQTRALLGSRRPKQPALTKAGVVYTPYVKVK